ncbi:elongation factor 1-beta-like isoform X1 [Stegodyphus dumicola]|uniref:elongation factor 1-beta-like isoform X1 n=1 Tax=Stegodyphus dumicola TaxID=202533 RepID=UPI0015AD9732|nr:elongation factor 1-beta-like isoform X1 [Stegodyphus dumicola]
MISRGNSVSTQVYSSGSVVSLEIMMALNGLPADLLNDYMMNDVEPIWFEANRFQEVERDYQELIAQQNRQRLTQANPDVLQYSLASEIAHARQKIQNFLKSTDVGSLEDQSSTLLKRVEKLEEESEKFRKQLGSLFSQLTSHLNKFEELENALNVLKDPESSNSSQKVKASAERNVHNGPAKDDDDDDDDIDLFGSGDESEEENWVNEERLKAYENKKAKKPAIVAKSSVVLDVKPWDDETDMEEMEKAVRKIETEGLKWGASKLVPLAYGIKKLQIIAIVEDDKVSVDWLQETIQDIEDLVQSVDIAAFNKL